MPRKKTTTPEPIKTEILQYSVPSFNLRTNDPEQLKQYAAYLESMLITPGWALLEKILNENLVTIGEQIIAKADNAGEELTEENVNLLRVQYAQIKQLLAMPKELVHSFATPKRKEEMPEYDAYKSVSDYSPRASTLADTT